MVQNAFVYLPISTNQTTELFKMTNLFILIVIHLTVQINLQLLILYVDLKRLNELIQKIGKLLMQNLSWIQMY
jgi:hypothetical protein